MRLIDADYVTEKLNEINGTAELDKAFEVVENAPTVDVFEQIRAEIEKVFCMSVVTNELRTPMEVKTEILQIIDKHISGDMRGDTDAT